MEIRQLQSVKQIIEQGSYQKAADVLGYVQSTITLHVHQLEEEFGLQLFCKEGRRMVLTQEGESFWEQARSLLEHVHHVEAHLAEIREGQAGSIRIGTVETIARDALADLLLDACTQFPKMKLTLELGGTSTILQKLYRDELDFGVCPIPQRTEGLLCTPLFVEHLSVLMPATHPMAHVETLTLRDIANTNLMLTEQVCSYRSAVETGFAHAGLSLQSSMEISDFRTLIRFVQAGIGCAILPTSLLHPVPVNTVVRTLEDVTFQLPIGFLRKDKPRTKLADYLQDQILAALR